MMSCPGMDTMLMQFLTQYSLNVNGLCESHSRANRICGIFSVKEVQAHLKTH